MFLSQYVLRLSQTVLILSQRTRQNAALRRLLLTLSI